MSNNIQRKKIAVGKSGDNNGVELFQGFNDDNIYYKTRKGGLVQLVDLETAQGLIGANNELSEILANGSTTGANNIIVSAGQQIEWADGAFTLAVDTATLAGNRSVSFQDADGTVALTSDIPELQGLDSVLGVFNSTGTNNISVDSGQNIQFAGAGKNISNTGLAWDADFIWDIGTFADYIFNQSGDISVTFTPTGDTMQLLTSSRNISFVNSGSGFTGSLDWNSNTLTDNRTWDLPDATGTIALTSDISSGIFGISDSSGVYTFYATIALANAAAVSGDVVELFADVEETGATEFIMKDGVTYNLNGHTYTLNVATTENTITDNNVAITSTLMNGRFIRTGGSASTTDSLTMHIDNVSSNIICEGVIFESDFGLPLNVDGGIEGATFKNTVYTGYMAYANSAAAVITRCSFESAAGGGVYLTGTLNDCVIIVNGSVGVASVSGTCNNCVITSNGNDAVNAQSTAFFNNCTITSTTTNGIETQTNGVKVSNCVITSSASYGVYSFHDIILENCSIYSSTNNGAFLATNSRLENCTVKAAAAAAVYSTGGVVVGSITQCLWNNASGHALRAGNNSVIFNNFLEVTNTSANNINNIGVTPTVTYGQNTYKGAATTPVEATIVQGQTNTHDTYGNIDIG